MIYPPRSRCSIIKSYLHQMAWSLIYTPLFNLFPCLPCNDLTGVSCTSDIVDHCRKATSCMDAITSNTTASCTYPFPHFPSFISLPFISCHSNLKNGLCTATCSLRIYSVAVIYSLNPLPTSPVIYPVNGTGSDTWTETGVLRRSSPLFLALCSLQYFSK